MSLYPQFDPDAYLQNLKGSPAKVANPAKESIPAQEISRLAELAGPNPLETDFAERAAICEFDGQIPREWAEGFAQLQSMTPPASIPEGRWLQVLNDTGLFLDSWGAKLAIFGWRTVPEVFGVHPERSEARLDSRGLVWALQGRKVLSVTAEQVAIETENGSRQSIYRRVGTETVPVWELRE